MINRQQKQIESTLVQLFNETKYDHLRMMKGFSKSVFRPVKPVDFKDVALAISPEQGEDLKRLIKKHDIKHIIEFGTSFGISTLYMASAILETEGHIVTTELIESKAKRAIENFRKAGVNERIEVRIGDAMETLKGHDEPIDLLLLDGWKDLYLPVFNMLEPNFHSKSLIYVDNADMAETRQFLQAVKKRGKYQFQVKFAGTVVIISIKK